MVVGPCGPWTKGCQPGCNQMGGCFGNLGGEDILCVEGFLSEGVLNCIGAFQGSSALVWCTPLMTIIWSHSKYKLIIGARRFVETVLTHCDWGQRKNG